MLDGLTCWFKGHNWKEEESKPYLVKVGLHMFGSFTLSYPVQMVTIQSTCTRCGKDGKERMEVADYQNEEIKRAIEDGIQAFETATRTLENQ